MNISIISVAYRFIVNSGKSKDKLVELYLLEMTSGTKHNRIKAVIKELINVYVFLDSEIKYYLLFLQN